MNKGYIVSILLSILTLVASGFMIISLVNLDSFFKSETFLQFNIFSYEWYNPLQAQLKMIQLLIGLIMTFSLVNIAFIAYKRKPKKKQLKL